MPIEHVSLDVLDRHQSHDDESIMDTITNEPEPEARQRTITLSNAAPVHIRDRDWPIVLDEEKLEDESKGASERINRRRWLTVRRHADGRMIVYGGLDTTLAGEANRRAGMLLDRSDDLAAAITRIGSLIHAAELACACIAALPTKLRT